MKKMKQISAVALSAVFLMTTGCASVVSKSSWPITINSVPENSRISITDKKGIEIYIGVVVVFSGLGRFYSRIKVGSAGSYFNFIMLFEIILGLAMILLQYFR